MGERVRVWFCVGISSYSAHAQVLIIVSAIVEGDLQTSTTKRKDKSMFAYPILSGVGTISAQIAESRK
jgi:hypothetical protein